MLENIDFSCVLDSHPHENSIFGHQQLSFYSSRTWKMHIFENFDVMSQPEYAHCGLCVHYEYAWTSLMAADQVITLQCQTYLIILISQCFITLSWRGAWIWRAILLLKPPLLQYNPSVTVFPHLRTVLVLFGTLRPGPGNAVTGDEWRN